MKEKDIKEKRQGWKKKKKKKEKEEGTIAPLYIIFFLIHPAPSPYVQGYSSHATYKILFSSNLQLDNDLVGSGLLILSVPQVDVPSRLVVEGNVEALGSLAQLGQSSDSLVVQVDLLEVLGNASLGDGLGDDAGATLQTPHEQDLLDRLALVVGELLELLVLVKR